MRFDHLILALALIGGATLASATPPPLPPGHVVGPPIDPPAPPPYPFGDTPEAMLFPPLPRSHSQPNPPAPGGDALGDVWEMEEVAGWTGVWLRRGKSRMFDGYWTHPNGERVRAPLEMWVRGYEVIAVRRHEGGQYCRYDGVISPDWVRIEGQYTCTWERTPMRWAAQIVRMDNVTPYILRGGAGAGR